LVCRPKAAGPAQTVLFVLGKNIESMNRSPPPPAGRFTTRGGTRQLGRDGSRNRSSVVPSPGPRTWPSGPIPPAVLRHAPPGQRKLVGKRNFFIPWNGPFCPLAFTPVYHGRSSLFSLSPGPYRKNNWSPVRAFPSKTLSGNGSSKKPVPTGPPTDRSEGRSPCRRTFSGLPYLQFGPSPTFPPTPGVFRVGTRRGGTRGNKLGPTGKTQGHPLGRNRWMGSGASLAILLALAFRRANSLFLLPPLLAFSFISRPRGPFPARAKH